MLVSSCPLSEPGESDDPLMSGEVMIMFKFLWPAYRRDPRPSHSRTWRSPQAGDRDGWPRPYSPSDAASSHTKAGSSISKEIAARSTRVLCPRAPGTLLHSRQPAPREDRALSGTSPKWETRTSTGRSTRRAGSRRHGHRLYGASTRSPLVRAEHGTLGGALNIEDNYLIKVVARLEIVSVENQRELDLRPVPGLRPATRSAYTN